MAAALYARVSTTKQPKRISLFPTSFARCGIGAGNRDIRWPWNMLNPALLDDLKKRMDRLCDAIENGILPDDVALEGSHNIQAGRQIILSEIAGLKRQQEFPFKDIGPKRINAFCSTVRAKLSDKESTFGKEYLKHLVEEIRVKGKDVSRRGRYSDVVNAMQKTALGFPVGLPRAGSVWLPERNAQQNFFTYHFGFLMKPIKKNHPRTEYRFQRIPC